MQRRVTISALVGLLLSLLWIILGFLQFDSDTGRLSHIYFLVGDIVCQIFPVNSSFGMFGPAINPFVYASIAWIILQFSKRRQRR